VRGLTEKQRDLYLYLCERDDNDQLPPTYAEMAAHTGGGLTMAVGRIRALEKKGLVRRGEYGQARGTVIIVRIEAGRL